MQKRIQELIRPDLLKLANSMYNKGQKEGILIGMLLGSIIASLTILILLYFC